MKFRMVVSIWIGRIHKNCAARVEQLDEGSDDLSIQKGHTGNTC